MVDIASNSTSTASFETAGQFTNSGYSYSGQFEFAGDEDWIPIFLQAGTAYSFMAGSTTEFGNGDVFLRVFDSSGRQAAADNDSGAGGNALASFTAGASGVYYVSVSQLGGLVGDYGIFVSSLSATNEVQGDAMDGHTAVAANARVLGGAGIDTLTLAPGAGIEAYGEQGDDTIQGNSFSNLLSGGLGDDTIHGGGAGDTIWGDAGDDQLFGDSGADFLLGGAGDDLIEGGDNFDFLRGGAGDDSMKGGAGVDTLDAGDGSDVLDGGLSADKMAGGKGNDQYKVDHAQDFISELLGGGIDTVLASVTFNLPLTQNGLFENLTLTGSANINAGGNKLANMITGNGGANKLEGADGNDVLQGAGGNDTLFGEVGSDTLLGGSGNDTLTADLGEDVLFGEAGNDTLSGGAGKDKLTGGVGADVLTGGTGNADRFIYASLADSTVAGSGRDRITDFAHQHGDRIDLSGIDASTKSGGNQAFSFISVLPFDGKAGQLHLRFAGNDTVVEGDINGDTKADFAITLTGLKALAAADFVL